MGPSPVAITKNHPNPDLASAQKLLALEAEAIKSLSAHLDDNFSKAVELILKIKGRVVCSGMGKSGLIAQKIAATMASTGTPSMFVHPAEASHGDLGMVTRADCLLLLSNSGETQELTDILHYSRRFGIPIIGIAGRAPSTLFENSDIGLLMPQVPEACPLGLAPTTSTTMMLALGDALAIAILERKGFTAEQFRDFHPGGKLGHVLLRVEDIMHGGDTMPLIPSYQKMSGAILEMSSKNFGCVGVIDVQGKLVGIITDGDLRRHMSGQLLEMLVDDVMTGNPRTIRQKALATEALALMNEKNITSLFVVSPDGKPVGLLHIHDILRAGVA